MRKVPGTEERRCNNTIYALWTQFGKGGCGSARPKESQSTADQCLIQWGGHVGVRTCTAQVLSYHNGDQMEKLKMSRGQDPYPVSCTVTIL